MAFHRFDGTGQLVAEPFDRQGGSRCLRGAVVHRPALDEPEGIPDLRAEIASLLHLRFIVEDVVAGAGAQQHADADGIGTIFGDEFQRVGAVAQGLGHLAAQFVAHDAGEIHVGEGLLAHELLAGHDHAGHPEEDDIRSRYQVVGGIVVGQVFVGLMFGMAGFLRIEHRNGPQPGREPGIQHVFVLLQVFGLEGRVDGLCGLQRRFRGGFHHVGSVRQVPGRDALSPPQLAGDAPVASVLHPMTVGIHVFLGNELRATAFHRLQGGGGQLLHLQEPLGGKFRFDHRIRPLAVSHRRGVVFHLQQVAGFLQHLHDLLAGHETVLTHQDLRFLVQFSVIVDDFQHGQVVPQADFIVVHVVRRRHLQAAGTEVHLHVIVLDHRDLPVDERDEHLLAFQPEMPLVLRIHADGGIGHDGLRTRGGNDQELVRGLAVAVGDVVFQVIEMALGVFVFHFVVTHGRERFGIPVHHADALVDPSFLVEIDKGIDNGLAQGRFHGEAGAVPIAGAAEFAQLLQDNAAMLFLPLPSVFEEFLAADIFFVDPLGLELGHHFAFRRNGGVVRSRYPAGVFAVHAGLADEHIVQRVVQHVSHVQDTRHVRRRNHNRIGFFIIRFRMEKLIIQPVGIPFVLHLGGIVFGR